MPQHEPKNEPKHAQDEPKIASRWPQDGSQIAPNCLQDASWHRLGSNMTPAWLKIPPRWPNLASKVPQHGPKMAPKCSNLALRYSNIPGSAALAVRPVRYQIFEKCILHKFVHAEPIPTPMATATAVAVDSAAAQVAARPGNKHLLTAKNTSPLRKKQNKNTKKKCIYMYIAITHVVK